MRTCGFDKSRIDLGQHSERNLALGVRPWTTAGRRPPAIPASAPGRLFTMRFRRHFGALEARSG